MKHRTTFGVYLMFLLLGFFENNRNSYLFNLENMLQLFRN